MQGIWLAGQKISFRDDIPVPVPGPGEALIRVSLAGICSTDLEMVKGYYPFTGVLGHEFIGQVVRTGEGSVEAGAWVGKRVVSEITIACGQCRYCRRGLRKHC